MMICVGAGQQHRRVIDRLNYKVKLLSEGLYEGECTSEYFKKKWEDIAEEYCDHCEFVNSPKQQADALFRKAHDYAVANNLKWGRIYD